MYGTLTTTLKFKAPPRLAEALEREAERRMISQAAVMRQALARELGLIDQGTDPITQQGNNE